MLFRSRITPLSLTEHDCPSSAASPPTAGLTPTRGRSMRPPFPSHRASRWSMPHPPAAAPVHGGRHSLTSLPVAYDFHLASCFPSALQPHDEPVRRHQSAPQPRLRSGRQQIVDTGHRAALEGSDRGSRSGCMLDAPPHLDCGWRRPSMPPTSSRPSGLPPLPDNKEHRRVRPRVPLLGILRRGCSTSSLAWEENVQHGQLEHGEEKPSPVISLPWPQPSKNYKK